MVVSWVGVIVGTEAERLVEKKTSIEILRPVCRAVLREILHSCNLEPNGDRSVGHWFRIYQEV